MFWKLFPALTFLSAVSLGAAQNRAMAPPPIPGISPPSIKMGLWEETTTSSGHSFKSRSCITPQSYQSAFGRMPPGCTVSHTAQTSHSIDADVSCSMNGVSSNGHLSVTIADSSTVHTTMTYTMQVQGRPMQGSITTDAEWIGASCGEIGPGESRSVD